MQKNISGLILWDNDCEGHNEGMAFTANDSNVVYISGTVLKCLSVLVKKKLKILELIILLSLEESN